MNKILIIEDDIDIITIEKDYLEMNGFVVLVLTTGENVINYLSQNSVDLIILDIMLPNYNGFEICKEIRKKYDIPILMVTAKGEVFDKIRGLGLGANDYITKPFDPSELVARVKTNLQNYQRIKGDNSEIIIDDIKIIPSSYKVYKDDKEIKLPSKEFELLLFLAINHNIVFSKGELFETIWGLDSLGNEATITVHINRIREKIEKIPAKPQIIETIWGVGYRLNK